MNKAAKIIISTLVLLVVVALGVYVYVYFNAVHKQQAASTASKNTPTLVSGFPTALLLDKNAKLKSSSVSSDGKSKLATFQQSTSVADEYKTYQQFFADNGFTVVSKLVDPTQTTVVGVGASYAAQVVITNDPGNPKAGSSTMTITVSPKA